RKLFPLSTAYNKWLYLLQEKASTISDDQVKQLAAIRTKFNLSPQQLQKYETILHYEQVDKDLQQIVTKSENKVISFTEKIDNILVHPILEYVIFFGILFLIFQAIYTWSGPLMDGVDELFAYLSDAAASVLPEGPLAGLIVNGI